MSTMSILIIAIQLQLFSVIKISYWYYSRIFGEEKYQKCTLSCHTHVLMRVPQFDEAPMRHGVITAANLYGR